MLEGWNGSKVPLLLKARASVPTPLKQAAGPPLEKAENLSQITALPREKKPQRPSMITLAFCTAEMLKLHLERQLTPCNFFFLFLWVFFCFFGFFLLLFLPPPPWKSHRT